MIEQLPEIQRLSESQKIQLATELWDELGSAPAAEPDPVIVRLLEQRYAEFKAGSHSSSSWEDVKRRIGNEIPYGRGRKRVAASRLPTQIPPARYAQTSSVA